MEREQVFQNIIRQIGNGHQEDYENLIDEIDRREEKKLNEEYQFESSRKEAAFIAVDEIQKKIAEIEYQRKNGKEKQDSLSRRLEKLNLQKEKWSFEIQEFTTRLDEFKEVNTDDISLPPYLDYHHLEQLMAEKETRLKNWDIRRGSISQLRDLQERQNYWQEKIAYFQEVVLQLEKNRIECEQLCHELFYEFLSEANFHFQNNFLSLNLHWYF